MKKVVPLANVIIYWLFKGGAVIRAGRGSGQAGRGREGRCKAVKFFS